MQAPSPGLSCVCFRSTVPTVSCGPFLLCRCPFCLPQYMPTIWGLLFSRLQSSRTAKFTR